MEDILKKLSEFVEKNKEHVAYIVADDNNAVWTTDVIDAIFNRDPKITENLYGVYKLRNKFKVSVKTEEAVEKLISWKSIKVKNLDLAIQGPLPNGERYRLTNIPPQLTDNLLDELLATFGRVLFRERDRVRSLDTGRMFVIFEEGSLKNGFSTLDKINIGKYEIKIRRIKSESAKRNNGNNLKESNSDEEQVRNDKEEIEKNDSTTKVQDQAQLHEEKEQEKPQDEPTDAYQISLSNFENAHHLRTTCKLGNGVTGKDKKVWISLDLGRFWTDNDHDVVAKLLNATEWTRGTRFSYFKVPNPDKYERYNYLDLYYY